MTETAGWGAPGFLPAHIQRRVEQDDAREAVESKRAEAAREAQAEERRQRALSLAAEQSAARGDVLDVLALARGEVPGRRVEDILAEARAAADRDDVIAAARLHRDGHGDPEPVHVEFGDPVIHGAAARSETGLKIFNRARKFRAVLDARRQLRDAERAAGLAAHDYGLVDMPPREEWP